MSVFRITLFSLVFSSCFAGTSFADESGTGPYAVGNLGFSFTNHKMQRYTTNSVNSYRATKKANNSFVFGYGFGYIFNNKIRSDIIVSHINGYKYPGDSVNDSGSDFRYYSTIKPKTFMFNTYYSFPGSKNGVRPFLGIGFGFVHIDPITLDGTNLQTGNLKNYLSAESSVRSAYSLICGLEFKLDDNFFMDASYNFNYLNEVNHFISRYTVNKVWTNINKPEAFRNTLRTHNLVVSLKYKF